MRHAHPLVVARLKKKMIKCEEVEVCAPTPEFYYSRVTFGAGELFLRLAN